MNVARALGYAAVSDEKTRNPLPKTVGLQADRSIETEPLEERSIGPAALPSWDPPAPVERCGWCNLPIRRHRPEALALCDAALRAAIERRRAGPLRVRDVAHAGRGGARP